MSNLKKALPELLALGFIIAILVMFVFPLTYISLLLGNQGLLGENSSRWTNVGLIILSILGVIAAVMLFRQAMKKVGKL